MERQTVRAAGSGTIQASVTCAATVAWQSFAQSRVHASRAQGSRGSGEIYKTHWRFRRAKRKFLHWLPNTMGWGTVSIHAALE